MGDKIITVDFDWSDKLADDAMGELKSMGLPYCVNTVVGTALAKLKLYEDTGLSPDEIMDGQMLTGWIPVEERFPDKTGWYLVTYCNGQNVDMAHYYYDSARWGGNVNDVSAWMPLPEPYRP
ncbi:MAG: DUF551 domain-containing protein [Lachnospiraceae bacterium]|nr:DUF551 domain-containing protein [Lachnospiraceae bacterium]